MTSERNDETAKPRTIPAEPTSAKINLFEIIDVLTLNAASSRIAEVDSEIASTMNSYEVEKEVER